MKSTLDMGKNQLFDPVPSVQGRNMALKWKKPHLAALAVLVLVMLVFLASSYNRDSFAKNGSSIDGGQPGIAMRAERRDPATGVRSYSVWPAFTEEPAIGRSYFLKRCALQTDNSLTGLVQLEVEHFYFI